MTKLQIIDETAEYYMADPSRRAFDHTFHFCSYLTKNGNMCAVGRCLIDPSAAEQQKFVGVHDFPDLDLDLKREYRGHGLNFWSALQDWHDCQTNWNETGLTEMGASHLEVLRATYA